MKPGPDADLAYLSHMVECINCIFGYFEGGESSFKQSHLIQGAVIFNLQTMGKSSQRLRKLCITPRHV